MSEDSAALDARKPFRGQANVSFDGFSGRQPFGDVLVYPKGLLLRTRYLKPVGTGVEFDVDVDAGGGRIETLRGRGLVVFSRWQDQGQRRPAGLGVRVEQLDDSSREALQRLFPPVAQGDLLGRVEVEETPPPLAPSLAIEDVPLAPAPPFPPSPSRSTPPWLVEESLPTEPLGSDDAVPDDLLEPVIARQPERPISSLAGGWRDTTAAGAAIPPDVPNLPRAETPYVATSRRWLEATAADPLEGVAKPALAGAEPVWPAAVPEKTEPPALDFAAHAQTSSESPRLLPWILVGMMVVLAAGAGYWAYMKYLDAPEQPRTAAPAAKPLPSSAPGSTLVEDVREATENQPSEPTPPAGAEAAGQPGAAPEAVPVAPAPAAPAAAPVAPPEAAAAAPVSAMSRLVDVRWEAVGPGGLRVTLHGDGAIESSRVTSARLNAPARQVIRLRSPVAPPARSQFRVDHELLRLVRLGVQANGDLQVVLDLGADEVRVAAPRFIGDRLEVLLSR